MTGIRGCSWGGVSSSGRGGLWGGRGCPSPAMQQSHMYCYWTVLDRVVALALDLGSHSGYSPTSAATNGQHSGARALTMPVVDLLLLLNECLKQSDAG